MIIGNPTSLGIDIGPFLNQSRRHQIINIWIDGKLMSQVDSTVYLPSFCTALDRDLEKLKTFDFALSVNQSNDQLFELLEEDLSDRFRVLRYDLTCSMADCFFVNNNGVEFILYAFWDPRYPSKEDLYKVFKLEISKREMLKILLKVSNVLSRTWI